MLTIIFCGIVALVLFLRIVEKKYQTIGPIFGSFVLGALTGLMIAFGIGEPIPVKEFAKEIKLVALKDTSGIRGTFFLGSGSVRQEFYYFFYKKEKDGSVTFDKLLARNVKIYEEERKDGVIKAFEKRPIKKISLSLFGFHHPANGDRDQRYEIHIPKGSIERTFKLDLQ